MCSADVYGLRSRGLVLLSGMGIPTAHPRLEVHLTLPVRRRLVAHGAPVALGLGYVLPSLLTVLQLVLRQHYGFRTHGSLVLDGRGNRACHAHQEMGAFVPSPPHDAQASPPSGLYRGMVVYIGHVGFKPALAPFVSTADKTCSPTFSAG